VRGKPALPRLVDHRGHGQYPEAGSSLFLDQQFVRAYSGAEIGGKVGVDKPLPATGCQSPTVG